MLPTRCSTTFGYKYTRHIDNITDGNKQIEIDAQPGYK